ncbi:hypothetical protein ACHAXH_005848 [Discostella pseudostelligera]
MISSRGPSLPPRVIGERIGTLTIRLLVCSPTDTYARVQFWGEPICSYVFPINKEWSSKSGAVGSHAIEYPLVGSIHALNSYLKDASPLQVAFLRRNEARRQRSGPNMGIDGALLDADYVGSAYIRDICIDNMPNLDSAQGNPAENINISLHRKLTIFRPNSEMNDQKSHIIGEAIFKLDFDLFADLFVAAPTASSLTIFPQDSPQNSLRRVTNANPPVPKIPCAHCKNCTHLEIGDSVRDQSGFSCATSTEEKRSLLEELLDLCIDDLTIPTVDSAIQSHFDPYDNWISRIVANANSPPAKEFPCLMSTGPIKSSTLRKVGMLKLEVDEITLMAEIANKVKDNVLYLQYNPHSFSSEMSVDVDLVEIRLCKQPGEQCKLVKTGRRSAAMKGMPIGRKNDMFLHRIEYAKQMQVNFNDDNSVRRWLDGNLDFSLFCQESILTRRPRLPRVAMLASKAKSTIPFSQTSKALLAKALFRLRDVILSETLSVRVELDLVATRNAVFEDVADADTVIGKLSMNLGLYPSIPSSATTESRVSSIAMADERERVVVTAPHNAPSVSIPHPISVLLSYFARAQIDDYVVGSAVDSSSPRQVREIKSAECGKEDYLSLKDARDQNAVPNSVTKPTNWLWVGVENMSISLLDSINEKKGCVKLGLSCTNQLFIQHGNVPPCISDCCSVHELGQEPFILRSYDGSTAPNSVCSWQVPLETETIDERFVILQILHCHNAADDDFSSKEQCLVGLSKIPFRVNPPNTSQLQLCNWLPDLVAQGPFDVLDPVANSLIGKLEVVIASGTLRQISGFSSTYQRILAIQRWWVKRFRALRRTKIEGSTHNLNVVLDTVPESPEKEIPQDSQNSSQEFDTIHGEFIAQHDSGRMKEIVSSPDSLFEEWSQQSEAASRSGYKNACSNAGSRIIDLPRDDASIDSMRSNSSDAFQTLHAVLDHCLLSRESGIAYSSDCGQINSSTLERTTSGCVEIERRLQQQHSPIKSLLNLNDCTENEWQHNVMSCLKPMKLEDSFSRGQENDICTRIGIDPPEEIKQNCKRKVETVNECVATAGEKPGDNKRYRVAENPNMIPTPCPQVLHDEKACAAHCTGDVENSFSPPESSFDCRHFVYTSDAADETLDCRSLTSVLGTLARINSMFTCGEDLHTRYCAPDNAINCFTEGEENSFPDVNIARTRVDDDVPSVKIHRPDPGRRIEPPEENNVALTPANPNEPLKFDLALVDTNKTCEKGSSPMSVVFRLVNASTSPTTIKEADETIENGAEDTQPRRNNDIERNQSAGISDAEIRSNNDHEFDEQLEHEEPVHAELSTSRLDQQPLECRELNLANRGLRRSSMYSRRVPPHLETEGGMSLSPLMLCTHPPRKFRYFSRDGQGVRSRIPKIGACAKPLADKVGTLTVDTERLERIFQS